MPFGTVLVRVVDEEHINNDALIEEFKKAEKIPYGWCMFAQVYQLKNESTPKSLERYEYGITGMVVPHEKAVRIKAILEESLDPTPPRHTDDLTFG